MLSRKNIERPEIVSNALRIADERRQAAEAEAAALMEAARAEAEAKAIGKMKTSAELDEIAAGFVAGEEDYAAKRNEMQEEIISKVDAILDNALADIVNTVSSYRDQERELEQYRQSIRQLLPLIEGKVSFPEGLTISPLCFAERLINSATVTKAEDLRKRIFAIGDLEAYRGMLFRS